VLLCIDPVLVFIEFHNFKISKEIIFTN
jgi:hypothetical protein